MRRKFSFPPQLRCSQDIEFCKECSWKQVCIEECRNELMSSLKKSVIPVVADLDVGVLIELFYFISRSRWKA